MIIPIYFPPYEDELFYSWICRLAEANGMALVDFGRIYLRTNNKRIMNSVTFEGIYWAIEKWDVHPDILDILLKHTVLVTEQQCEINEKQKRNQYIFPRNLQAFLYNRGENEFYDAPGLVGKNQHKIRICTECLKKDIENGREAYIRTYHCLNGIDMCSVHKCPLMEINGFPNHDVTGKFLSTDEESLQRSQEKYELYKNTISMETENDSCS